MNLLTSKASTGMISKIQKLQDFKSYLDLGSPLGEEAAFFFIYNLRQQNSRMDKCQLTKDKQKYEPRITSSNHHI